MEIPKGAIIRSRTDSAMPKRKRQKERQLPNMYNTENYRLNNENRTNGRGERTQVIVNAMCTTNKMHICLERK